MELELEQQNLKIERPSSIKDRTFVDAIIFSGMSETDAYCYAYGVDITENSKSEIKQRTFRKLQSVPVRKCIERTIQSIAECDADKVRWNREKATARLVNLINVAESEIYAGNKKGLTMARTQAILGAIKELSDLHGLKREENISHDSPVIIDGEFELID